MNSKAIVRAVGVAAVVCISGTVAMASSHREAPLITESPKVDGTDFYMFNSYEPGREGYVTLIANYQPLQVPIGGPNYFTMDPDALYEIHVSNDNDAEEEISFQFRFKNKLQNISLDIDGKQIPIPLKQAGQIGPNANETAALNEIESYQIKVVYGDRRKGDKYKITNLDTGSKKFIKPVDNIGNKTLPAYENYANQHINHIAIPGCGTGRVFVGQRQEGFSIDLGGVFDLVNFVPIDSSAFPGGIVQDSNNNTLANLNVTTIALEIPASCLTAGQGSAVIGAWTTASLREKRVFKESGNKYSKRSDKPVRHKGDWVQVSRLGSPLVNEVVIGLPDKDLFNRSEPKDDAQFADYVTNPSLPALLDILFRDAVNATLGTTIVNLAPTNFPRVDLVAAFLTGFAGVNQSSGVSEMLRLNTAIPASAINDQNTLGVAAGDVAGFPNGRRPGDDVVDIALRVMMGALCHDLPLGENGAGVNLLLCGADSAAAKASAVVGNVPFTDGAPISATEFQNQFPYLNTPLAGS